MNPPLPLVLLAAGGTGGHLFPAEALAAELGRRGIATELATDQRATRYSSFFPERKTHIIASDTIRSRNPVSLLRTTKRLGRGIRQSYQLLGDRPPAAVVGFGGYPTLPPMAAAIWRRIPTVLHEANSVMGRANRLLARHVTVIATAFAGVTDADPRLKAKTVVTGNPLRQPVIDAAARAYQSPEPQGLFKLLVFGGSQGAQVFGERVPAALALVPPLRRAQLIVTQQVREEDLPQVRAAYAKLGINADLAPFFRDLPARIADAHLVISRAGASTVTELAAIGRPSILVPLPHALDQDQSRNADMLRRAGGAILLPQVEMTPEHLAQVVVRLMDDAAELARMARHARAIGQPAAATALADLVMRVSGLEEGRAAA